MPISILEACKKRKRTSRFYDLHTFADPGCPISPTGPFRDNIRYFLEECAELEDYNVEGMPIWCTFLVQENRGFVVPLYTIEESVKHSLQPFCDQCRCTGWSHHFVSKRKYHLIIPIDDEWNKPLNDGVFDLQTHLLHGLIHCNGFGHLLCINGTEGGSKYLCGRELMDLWDRICTTLHTRKITVEDASRKKNMDLRLLHGVAYGHPWFGRWGYRFCHGSFGVTEPKYIRAIQILGSLELDTILHNFRCSNQCRNIKHIISCYQDLSETNLITIRDLLRFMLALKSRAPLRRKPPNLPSCSSRLSSRTPNTKEKCVKYKKFANVACKLDSRWPVRRLEYTANVIVDALKAKKAEDNRYGSAGMTRQEARDAARMYIGDTGLIDYVLKSMNNVIIGDNVVRREVNPLTRILEYSILETGDGVRVDSVPVLAPDPVSRIGSNVYSDMSYLYDNVLLDYPDSETVESAVQTVLDSKHFVKEWPFRDEADDLLRFLCRVDPDTRQPGELVTVPLHATVGELKRAAEIAFRDTYCITEKIHVTGIEGDDGVEDGEVIFGFIESGSEIRVLGREMDNGTEMKYEGGDENWTVRCKCGARDDDGERMMACDVCETWQHTRCTGIEDSEEVPPLFVCTSCCAALVVPPPLGEGGRRRRRLEEVVVEEEVYPWPEIGGEDSMLSMVFDGSVFGDCEY